MTTTHITDVGSSLGVVLPPNVLERLNLSKGDQLCLIDTANGVEIVSLTPQQAEQLEIGRRVIAANREALQELAK